MSQVPSDPKDDDNVRGILESMWELTSADGSENDPDSRPISIDPDTTRNDTSSSASSADENGSVAGTNGRPPLMDVLNGEESPADPGVDVRNATSDVPTDNDLAALQYKGDPAQGHYAASEEQPMAPDTGHDERNGSHLNGNHSVNSVDGEFNVELSGGKNQEPRPAEPAPSPNPAPQQAAPNPGATPPSPDDNANVKRQMAPFKDTRMSRLSDGAQTRAAPPQTQPAPQQSAPGNTSQEPIRANVPAIQDPQAVAQGNHPEHDQLVPSGRDAAAELMRPVLRQWLGENMPKIVETALEIEAKETLHPDDPNNKQEK